MIDESDFIDIIRKIVKEEFPTEEISFELGGVRVIQQVYINEGHIVPSQGVKQFQFISEATVVLSFVQLIAATFLSLKKVYNTVNHSQEPPPLEILSDEWKRQLVDAGIPEEKVVSIVSNFSKDLNQYIKLSSKKEQTEST